MWPIESGATKAVDFSVDGQYLAFGGASKKVAVWSAVHQKLVCEADVGDDVHMVRGAGDPMPSCGCGVAEGKHVGVRPLGMFTALFDALTGEWNDKGSSRGVL